MLHFFALDLMTFFIFALLPNEINSFFMGNKIAEKGGKMKISISVLVLRLQSECGEAKKFMLVIKSRDLQTAANQTNLNNFFLHCIARQPFQLIV